MHDFWRDVFAKCMQHFQMTSGKKSLLGVLFLQYYAPVVHNDTMNMY